MVKKLDRTRIWGFQFHWNIDLSCLLTVSSFYLELIFTGHEWVQIWMCVVVLHHMQSHQWGCIVVDQQCRESNGKVKIEWYLMSRLINRPLGDTAINEKNCSSSSQSSQQVHQWKGSGVLKYWWWRFRQGFGGWNLILLPDWYSRR